MTTKVLMLPHVSRLGKATSGIARVVENYFKFLPAFDIEMVEPDAESYDLSAIHAGMTGGECTVAHTHGMYWSADYDSPAWEYDTNAKVIAAIRHAKEVTVPSHWVAETFQRDMHFTPHVIPHGIEWDAWQHDGEHADYVLYNKNRTGDVCDTTPLDKLVQRFPHVQFISTFSDVKTDNLLVTGLMVPDEMKKVVQRAGIYLATTKETFGIGILEAMASGVPVLGYAHGGILDLVEHGVNGFLAAPGNEENLAEGLAYCLEHRDVLGENGREMAKGWTWEAACERVAEVYRLALQVKPPTVAIVIPTFNYSELVGDAIVSAVRQDYQHLTNIIVVDDGSSDDGATAQAVEAVAGHIDAHVEELQAAVERLSADYAKTLTLDEDGKVLATSPGSVHALDVLDKASATLAEAVHTQTRLSLVEYVYQPNQGVAMARNNGIAMTDTKYVSCLDADDRLEPTFLSKLVPTLESDESVGVAYSRLLVISPDGKKAFEGRWPGECDFDAHLKGQNQVPTCCVFRRKAWERLGGYRQRYAPTGCGSEDAEFWLRMGSAGWDMKLASEEPLFLYTMGGLTTGGDPAYEEPDWLRWHPFTRDKQHPFASIATPAKQSHKVRQYDEPIVSVVIPVGPGHEGIVIDALDSLEAQTFRKWEAIVVWDCAPGEGEFRSESFSRVNKGYPFIRMAFTWKSTSRTGPKGTGYARNLGVSLARGTFLLFLDADDYLLPDALSEMLRAYGEALGDVAVYADSVNVVMAHDEIVEQAKREERFLKLLPGDRAMIIHRWREYNWEEAQRQPNLERPYIFCHSTTLHPRSWWEQIGGFDESMPSWEDWDYWLRLARFGKCFVGVKRPLFVYRLLAGNRREKGRQEAHNLVQYMRAKYRSITAMPCVGCGRRSRQVRRGSNPGPNPRPLGGEQFVMCRYEPVGRHSHGVVGAAAFPERHMGNMLKTRGGYAINYGHRSRGEMFYVHKKDVALQPQLFIPVESPEMDTVKLPRKRVATPAPPRRVREPIPEPEPKPKPVEAEAEAKPEAEVKPSDATFSPQVVPGIGPGLAAQMVGIDSVEAVISLGVDGLTQYKGVGQRKAEVILAAAQSMLTNSDEKTSVMEELEKLLA